MLLTLLFQTSRYSSKLKLNKKHKNLEAVKENVQNKANKKDCGLQKSGTNKTINNYYTKGQGEFYLPVQNAKEEICSEYTLFKPRGIVEVFPVSSGIVVFVGKSKAGKDTVIMLHDGGFLSTYSNLCAISVIKGDLIKNHNVSLGEVKSELVFSLKEKSGSFYQRSKKRLKKRDKSSKV